MRRAADGVITECTPPAFDVRTKVHEYGGGAFAIDHGTIYFANFHDQRLYRQPPGHLPEPLTPAGDQRFADMVFDHDRGRLICIQEDHTVAGEAVNAIVSIDLQGANSVQVLVSGNDFYSNPRLSPDGKQLAYLTWNHPNMPWDGCELCLAAFNPDGTVESPRRIAGGASESIFQPEWSPEGVLHFVGEQTGWWNLYRWRNEEIEALCPMQAEFGRAMWLFTYSTYGFVTSDSILCCYTENGIDHLGCLDTETKTIRRIPAPYTEIDFLKCIHGTAAFIGGSPLHPTSVVMLDVEGDQMTPIREAFEVEFDHRYISQPEEIVFPSAGGRQAHLLLYRPANNGFVGPADARPPLIVLSHGGPTSAASTTLSFLIQFWTSRGIAVADVNYGGSTGYGMEYRRSLHLQWGIVDIEDCCSAALFLAGAGFVDRRRMAIKGRSAGGFTTFACLTFRNEVFGAGSAHFGVADLEIFTRHTHKFESHYLATLVGPYPARRDLYVQRSPINFIDNLRCPLILFQGDEDTVVLPEQSRMMFEAVRRKGLPTAYVLFAGERHGFRKAETLRRALEAELYFLSRVFGFGPADTLEPVDIENDADG